MVGDTLGASGRRGGEITSSEEHFIEFFGPKSTHILEKVECANLSSNNFFRKFMLQKLSKRTGCRDAVLSSLKLELVCCPWLR